MDHKTPSVRSFNEAGLLCHANRKTGQQTVVQLIDDQAAMDDWRNNIEIIRQKELDVAGRQGT